MLWNVTKRPLCCIGKMFFFCNKPVLLIQQNINFTFMITFFDKLVKRFVVFLFIAHCSIKLGWNVGAACIRADLHFASFGQT